MAVKAAAAVAVILVVVMVLALFFVFPLRRATLVIDVKSNHIFATVSFRLLLDSKLIGSGMLSPFSTTQYTWELNWTYGQGGCLAHNVYADSTGGLTGPQNASTSVTVCASETKNVELII